MCRKLMKIKVRVDLVLIGLARDLGPPSVFLFYGDCRCHNSKVRPHPSLTASTGLLNKHGNLQTTFTDANLNLAAIATKVFGS